MSTEVLIAGMVLAGLCHASWNLLTKSANGDAALVVCALGLVSGVLGLPWVLTHLPTDWWPLLPIIVARALLQCGYIVCLGRAYRAMDFSRAYPVARGTGPVVAATLALLILDERPAVAGVVGILLVSAGVLSLAMVSRSGPRRSVGPGGVGWAIATGCTTGVYTIVDKTGVERVDALSYLFLTELLTSLLVVGALFARGHGGRFLAMGIVHGPKILIGTGLYAFAYGFALTAMASTLASYIAPLREISVLFGVALGWLVLKETGARQRIPSAVVIVAGVVLVGLAL